MINWLFILSNPLSWLPTVPDRTCTRAKMSEVYTMYTCIVIFLWHRHEASESPAIKWKGSKSFNPCWWYVLVNACIFVNMKFIQGLPRIKFHINKNKGVKAYSAINAVVSSDDTMLRRFPVLGGWGHCYASFVFVGDFLKQFKTTNTN